MGNFVTNKAIKMMNKRVFKYLTPKALILGITFKENCPDIRNSKVPDIYNELKSFGMKVDAPFIHTLIVIKLVNVLGLN